MVFLSDKSLQIKQNGFQVMSQMNWEKKTRDLSGLELCLVLGDYPDLEELEKLN